MLRDDHGLMQDKFLHCFSWKVFKYIVDKLMPDNW